jgi:hypothetical protein
VAALVATGADTLWRGLPRYERNLRGVAWRARLTHALVEADRHFPIGLQRLATLEWPDGSTSTAAGTDAERTLVEHLGARNASLREDAGAAAETAAETERELHASVADRDERLRSQRLAVMLGRGTATLVPTLLLVALAVVVLVAVGWTSVWGLLGNVSGIATGLLTVLGLLYSGLARVNLLADPAKPLAGAAEKVAVPVISALGKLKRG